MSLGLSWAGQFPQRGIFGSPGFQHVGGEGERDSLHSSLSVSPLPSALLYEPEYYAPVDLAVKPPGFCTWEEAHLAAGIGPPPVPCLWSGALCVLHTKACSRWLSLVRVWASASSLCVDFHNIVHSVLPLLFPVLFALVGFSF